MLCLKKYVQLYLKQMLMCSLLKGSEKMSGRLCCFFISILPSNCDVAVLKEYMQNIAISPIKDSVHAFTIQVTKAVLYFWHKNDFMNDFMRTCIVNN